MCGPPCVASVAFAFKIINEFEHEGILIKFVDDVTKFEGIA